MSIIKVLPIIDSLPHRDKFQLVQLIISQLANEEEIYSAQTNTLPRPKSRPKPIGKVYYSGRSDASIRARELLFKEKIQTIQQRNQS